MAPILNLRAISVSDLLSTTTKTATDLVSDTVNMLENLPLTRKDSGSGDPNNSQTPDQSGSSGNITTVIIICIIGLLVLSIAGFAGQMAWKRRHFKDPLLNPPPGPGTLGNDGRPFLPRWITGVEPTAPRPRFAGFNVPYNRNSMQSRPASPPPPPFGAAEMDPPPMYQYQPQSNDPQMRQAGASVMMAATTPAFPMPVHTGPLRTSERYLRTPRPIIVSLHPSRRDSLESEEDDIHHGSVEVEQRTRSESVITGASSSHRWASAPRTPPGLDSPPVSFRSLPGTHEAGDAPNDMSGQAPSMSEVTCTTDSSSFRGNVSAMMQLSSRLDNNGSLKSESEGGGEGSG